MTTLTPQAFVDKWRHVELKERAACQEHFIDLCRLIDQPTPAEADPTGEHFAFEYGAAKQDGGQGFADVFKRGYFGWEYKGKHANLDKAYGQLLQYRSDLQNPPLLVVCDMDRIIIHTNFTNTVHAVTTLALSDLLTADGLKRLRAIFTEPDAFKVAQTTEQVTRQAAEEFAKLAELLRAYGTPAHEAAHFLIRVLFCLFSEDAGLLPDRLFTRIITQARQRPKSFGPQVTQLFQTMATGGFFGADEIKYFDGRLFDNAAVFELDTDSLDILRRVSTLDWANIEPSIFGTLFVRSLDPAKRSQLGAQYTSKDDILLILEPVLMAPLRRRWTEIQTQAHDLAAQRKAATGAKRTKLDKQLRDLLIGFATELATVSVLDPACGSGNFLYLALVLLLDLWKEVSNFMAELGYPRLMPTPDVSPSPLQLHGLEKDEYAHELAQTTIWIGYIQWFIQNGFGFPPEPILRPIDTVTQMDAILTLAPTPALPRRETDLDRGGSTPTPPPVRAVGERGEAYAGRGAATEPDWPPVDVIVGNPPFLGGGKIRSELGDEYTKALFKLYGDRLPNFSDLVCYWFEKARAMIEQGKAKRAGLLATQAIRAGASRRVLERIKQTGDIFWAQSDREWTLDGAAVRVSMVGFDNGLEKSHSLDEEQVIQINADLTTNVDLTQAAELEENKNICYQGPSPKAPFDIEESLAQTMMRAPLNPNGRPNSDVVRELASASDLVQGSRSKWTIDFGLMSKEDAAFYEMPFEYVKKVVLPVRKNRRDDYRGQWWQYARPRPEMRAALAGKRRYIVTPRVAKHRIFIWLSSEVLANDRTFVFVREDDYFFGVLHSRIHEVWSLATSSRHGDGSEGGRPTYNNSTCFETFPFPWPPGQEPSRGEAFAQATQSIGNAAIPDNSTNTSSLANASPLQCQHAIADAARELVQLRDAWLTPPPTPPVDEKDHRQGERMPPSPVEHAFRSTGESHGEATHGLGMGVKRTLTNLYNARPTWLDNAHRKLDAAVFAAYGWPSDLSDDEILSRLLALNLERAK